MQSLYVHKLPSSEVSTLAETQGYFPVIVALPSSAVGAGYCVFRGGAGHFGVEGRLDAACVPTTGKAGVPAPITKSGWDDRNPAVGVAQDGTIVVAYHKQGSYDDAGRFDGKNVRVETAVIRSTDGGATFSEPTLLVGELAGCSPYGRIVTMPDGTLLLSLYGIAGTPPSFERSACYIVRSTDSGQTWSDPTLVAIDVDECAFCLLQNGDLVGALRTSDDAPALAITRSTDGGRSFTSPLRTTGPNEHPGDLTALSDGTLLLSYGRRHLPFGARARFSRDGGVTWDPRELIFSDSCTTADCGYPSTVRFANGTLATVFYDAQNAWVHKNGPIEGSFARLIRYSEAELLAALSEGQ